jgi:nitrogen fixation protein FixH
MIPKGLSRVATKGFSMREDSDYQPKGRPLTGRTVLLMLLGFFGVMLVANFIMARMAVKTFSGLDQKNPYDVGVAYNQEIAAAKAQAELGWSVDLTRTHDGPATQVTAAVKDRAGRAVGGLEASMHFFYPATQKLDKVVVASATADGVYSGAAELPRGHWEVEIDLKRDGERLFRTRNTLDIE